MGYLGRYQEARRHLETALTAHRNAGASLLVGRTVAALDGLVTVRGSHKDAAPAAAARLPTDGQSRRSGSAWQLRWNGTSSTAPDSKGMRDLAVLLASPRADVSVLDLVEAANGPAAAAAGGHAGERRSGATPMSVALAWLLQRSPNVLLIPGTSSVAHLRENVAGAGLAPTDKDIAELEKTSPASVTAGALLRRLRAAAMSA